MAGIDYFFLLIIIVCAIICMIKGFVDSFFDKAAPVLSVIAAVFLYRSFTGLMSKFITNSLLCTIVTFLIIFVVVFILIKILQKIIGHIFEEKILGSLNRTLGFAFGVVEALAIISLVLFLLSSQPFFDSSKLLNDSFFFNIFRKILGDKFIPSWEKTEAAVNVARFIGFGGGLV